MCAQGSSSDALNTNQIFCSCFALCACLLAGLRALRAEGMPPALCILHDALPLAVLKRYLSMGGDGMGLHWSGLEQGMRGSFVTFRVSQMSHSFISSSSLASKPLHRLFPLPECLSLSVSRLLVNSHSSLCICHFSWEVISDFSLTVLPSSAQRLTLHLRYST